MIVRVDDHPDWHRTNWAAAAIFDTFRLLSWPEGKNFPMNMPKRRLPVRYLTQAPWKPARPAGLALIFCWLHCAACACESDYSKRATTASFNAVGDIMLARGVGRAIERHNDPLHPFNGMRSALAAVDFNFGNLETPISGHPLKSHRPLVFDTKLAHSSGLSEFNFKIVNLANNHALDQGINGLKNTWNVLDQRGIQHIGTGPDLDSAWRAKIVVANQIRFAFIGASYTSINDRGKSRNDYIARIDDKARLRHSIQNARSIGDFLVVTMHAGNEYTRAPNAQQIDFARRAIDAGAEMVIGAHPHWIQTIESYKGKPIFYSLGNFIFDQRKPGTQEGLILKIKVRRTASHKSSVTVLERIDLLPVVLEKTVPRPAGVAESRMILKKIGYETGVFVPSN